MSDKDESEPVTLDLAKISKYLRKVHAYASAKKIQIYNISFWINGEGRLSFLYTATFPTEGDMKGFEELVKGFEKTRRIQIIRHPEPPKAEEIYR